MLDYRSVNEGCFDEVFLLQLEQLLGNPILKVHRHVFFFDVSNLEGSCNAIQTSFQGPGRIKSYTPED